MKKERSSNIELLRIIAMLMIIVYHIWSHCICVQIANDLLYFNNPFIYKKLMLLDVFSPFGQIANGIFILISGYFMFNKKIDLSKISKKLIFQSLFSTIVLMLFSTIVYKLFEDKSVHLITINFFNQGSWFIGYYFIVILCAYLFLNNFLSKLKYKEYTNMLIVLFAIIQFKWLIDILNSISFEISVFLTGIFLYSLGAYIRQFNPFKKIKSRYLYGVLLVVILLMLLSYYNLNSTNIRSYYINGSINYSQSVNGYANNYFVPVIASISLFELFLRFKIKKNYVINYIGSATLMIYLLHDNDFVYSLLKNIDWLLLISSYPLKFIYYFILSILAIFEIGLLIYILYGIIKKLISRFVKAN